MDCSSCELNKAQRAQWGCGWLAPDERTGVYPGPGMSPPSEWHVEPSICPGYSTELPGVIEAQSASWWMEKGYLERRYEGALSQKLLDAIEIYAKVSQEVELHEIRTKNNANGDR